jgi:hypothetical protein
VAELLIVQRAEPWSATTFGVDLPGGVRQLHDALPDEAGGPVGAWPSVPPRRTGCLLAEELQVGACIGRGWR